MVTKIWKFSYKICHNLVRI